MSEEPTRRLIVATFLTLDGVMQAPGGVDEDTDGGFAHGGWQMPYFDDMGGAYVAEGMANSDAFLLGRKTYEIFAAYWPTATNDFAAVMNGMTKYVASRTLDMAEWQNSTVLKGDVPTEVATLKQMPGKDISVIGSGKLAQTLIKHDLVDEYRLMIHPVVVGNGKRLFNDVSDSVGLVLIDSKTTSTGTLLLTYRPGRSDTGT